MKTKAGRVSAPSERVAWWAMLALPGALPVVIGAIPFASRPPFTQSPFIYPKLFTLALLVAVSVLSWGYGVIRGSQTVRTVALGRWLAGFIGLAAASTAFAMNPSMAFFGGRYQLIGLMSLLLAAGVFLMMTQVLTSPARIRAVSWSTVAGGVIVAIVTILQSGDMDPLGIARTNLYILHRGPSLLGNPDFTGTYLVVPVLIAAALALSATDARQRLTAWASCAVTFTAVAVSLTRGAWVGVVVGGVALVVALAQSEGGRRGIGWLLGGFGLVLAVAVMLRGGPATFLSRFSDLSSAATAGDGRFVLWGDALSVIRQHPLLGTGPDSYRLGWYGVRSLASVSLSGVSTTGASLTGVIGADVVDIDSSAYVATFDTKNVSTGTTVTVTGVALSGGDAGNYTVDQPTGLTADITIAGVTIDGAVAEDKVYDGTTAATVDFTGASLNGDFGGDDVDIDSSAYVAVFDTANVSTGTTVTVTGVALSGADAGNYALTQPTGLTADITALDLAITANDKSYDGTVTATLASADIVAGDDVTLVYAGAAFDTKDVGTNKDVTVTGLVTLAGTDAGNYAVVQPADLTADITAKALTISGAVAANKVYDGTTTATVNFTGASLVGVVDTEIVTFDTSGYSAVFDTKNIGVAKPVTVTGVTIAGADAGNYTLTQPTLSANITAKALTISGAVANNKMYDGTTAATVNFTGASLTGIVDTEIVTIDSSGYIADFNNNLVGVDKPVTVTGVALSGADAGNYTVTQPAGLTADITPNAAAVRTVWRFRSKVMFGSYLWTIDPNEMNTVRNDANSPWLFEGPAFTINAANPLNNATMVRFRNRADGSYFWSADPIEIAHLTNNLSATWIREGNAFNVSRTPTSTPVWRFRCLKNSTHFWTMDPNEKQTIDTTLQSDYALEGIAYYLGQ